MGMVTRDNKVFVFSEDDTYTPDTTVCITITPTATIWGRGVTAREAFEECLNVTEAAIIYRNMNANNKSLLHQEIDEYGKGDKL